MMSRDVVEQPHIQPKHVANLWTEFIAHEGEALIPNGKDPQNLTNSWWLQLSKRQTPQKLSFLPNL
jgi:hypothetical protein